MTRPDWAAFLPFLAGLIALTAVAFEPDDETGPDLHGDPALFTITPWV